jgi:hypothetical protein
MMSQESTPADPPVDHATLRRQQEQWTHTFATHPDMYGTEPSNPARAAAASPVSCDHAPGITLAHRQSGGRTRANPGARGGAWT